MQTQHIGACSARSRLAEAFQTQTRRFAADAYKMPQCSGMIGDGRKLARLNKDDGQAAHKPHCALMSRDRRLTCRTVSRALWLWPSWPSWQPAPSRKKNSSLSTQSRSRPNRFTPESSSKVTDLVTGQAFGPVLVSIRQTLREQRGGSC